MNHDPVDEAPAPGSCGICGVSCRAEDTICVECADAALAEFAAGLRAAYREAWADLATIKALMRLANDA